MTGQPRASPARRSCVAAHLRSVARPDALVAPVGVPRRCCVGGPVVLALLIRDRRRAARRPAFRSTARASAARAIFGMMIWLLYIRFIVPVLGVFYGTSLIADEVDDKTITYLFTRPIPARRGAAGQIPRLSRLHGAARPAVGDAGVLPDRADRRRRHRRGVSVAASAISACWRSASPPTARCSRWSARGSSGRWSSGWCSRSGGNRWCCCFRAT